MICGLLDEDKVLFSFSNLAAFAQVLRGGPWGFNKTHITLTEYDGIVPIVGVSFRFSSYLVQALDLTHSFRTECIIQLM